MWTTAARAADRPGGGPGAAARRPGGTAAALLALHRTAGNAAVARLIGDLPVQRMTINGEKITPKGASGRALWDAVRVALIDNGLSPWGAKKKFDELVNGSDEYDTRDAFVNTFLDAAKKEASRTLASGERGWTRELQLRRPAWPAAHKANAGPGQDIRHVVRNATIKKALDAEYWSYRNETERHDAFAKLAGCLGIEEKYSTAWEYLKKIYVKAYLNPGNLFVAGGAVNRVIGLTADWIWDRGIELVDQDPEEATEPLVKKHFDEVRKHVNQKCKDMEKGSTGDQKAFFEGFEGFKGTFFAWLAKTEEYYLGQIREVAGVEMSDIGSEFMDIAMNFSFDLPIKAVPDNMPVLIDTQKFLDSYGGGKPKELAAQLDKFFRLKSILEQPSKT